MADRAFLESHFISVTEAGALLGVQRARAYALASQGVFPTVRVGGRIRVPRPAFDAWLTAQAEEALSRTILAERSRA